MDAKALLGGTESRNLEREATEYLTTNRKKRCKPKRSPPRDGRELWPKWGHKRERRPIRGHVGLFVRDKTGKWQRYLNAALPTPEPAKPLNKAICPVCGDAISAIYHDQSKVCDSCRFEALDQQYRETMGHALPGAISHLNAPAASRGTRQLGHVTQ